MNWSLDPTIIIGLILLAALYTRGLLALARRAGNLSTMQRQKAWAFAGAMVVLIGALLSPLDTLVERFFSAHMMQHSLLILAAAPLLALSSPLPALLLGLPAHIRRALGSGWQRSEWIRRTWHCISRPMVAWLMQAAILWAWHIPWLYQAAIADDRIHAVEHLSMLGSALLFWWVALHSFGNHPQARRQGRLAVILYLLTGALPGGLLGVLLQFAPAPWYSIYNHPDGPLSPLADQQLAAAMMWAPSGTIYLLAAVLKMRSWLGTDRLHAAQAQNHPSQ